MKRLTLLLSFFVLFFTLAGCELLNQNEDRIPNEENQVVVEGIEIKQSLVQPSYNLETFDLSTIALSVFYSDNTMERVPLEIEHILHEDVHKLSLTGMHRIEVKYTTYTTSFKLILLEEKTPVDEETTYYFPEELPYNGPRLDADFFDVIPYKDGEEYGQGNPYLGTGGAFYVEYDPSANIGRCIDGDTTLFMYPQDVFDKITSNAKSTRYLNVDTPETWSGGEEQFGYLATLYVCDLLERAEAIVLQTDPGDNLVGNYGRLLAWVWILLPGEDDFQLLNYMIVRQGLGEVKYLFGAGETDVTMYDGFTYTEWMFYAEEQAYKQERGIYGRLFDYYWDYENNMPYHDREE